METQNITLGKFVVDDLDKVAEEIKEHLNIGQQREEGPELDYNQAITILIDHYRHTMKNFKGLDEL